MFAGNLAYHLLRRVQFLHQIPADELSLPLQELLCPGSKPDFQRCPNIVNPQHGFCNNHLGNLTNRVQGQPLVEPALVAEYKKALLQALQFPDDNTLVSNAIHLGNNLHMATTERMRTAHTMRDLAENRHADHLMQAQQLTYAATEHSNAAYLSAAANIQKVSALPAIASSRSIFSSLPSLPAPQYSAPLQLSSGAGSSSMYQQLPDARPDGRWMLEAAAQRQTIIHDTPPSSPSQAAPTLVREANQPATPLPGVPAIQPPPPLPGVPAIQPPPAPPVEAAIQPAATKPKRKASRTVTWGNDDDAPVPKRVTRSGREH